MDSTTRTPRRASGGRIAAGVLAAVVAGLPIACAEDPAPAAPVAAAAPSSPPPVVRTAPPVTTTTTTTTTTTALPPARPGPANGTVVVAPEPRGAGELAVENGTGQDAYVVLAEGDDVVVSVYVRAGQDARARRIPDGTYVLYFVMGTDWDPAAPGFTRGVAAQRFEETFPYTTGDTTTEWTVTLQPTVGGTARTAPVPTDAVPG